jgi:hypothetical protein
MSIDTTIHSAQVVQQALRTTTERLAHECLETCVSGNRRVALAPETLRYMLGRVRPDAETRHVRRADAANAAWASDGLWQDGEVTAVR